MFSSIAHLTGRQVARGVLRRYCSTAEVGSTEYFQKLVQNSPVVVFIKGTPAEPRCGFSNAVVQVMRMHGVEYESHDVLSDDRIRHGIKEFSSWPTIPQVYLKSEFVGGCDIVLQMHQSGEFVEELKKVGITSALLEEEKKDEPKDT